MITIKNDQEIAYMRQAGRIVALVLEQMAKEIVPGVTTLQLNKIAEKIIRENGATPSFKGYHGFPCAICSSINNQLIHGIPDKTLLKEGDIISIDVGACFHGYHGDGAWTYAVGQIDEQSRQLMEVTKESLFKGLAMVKANNRVGDISNAIQTHAESFGYGVPREYTGHGIGSSMHEDPYVPNYGIAGHGPALKKNMVIAIEPMVQQGSKDTVVLSDGWTVVSKDGKRSAHYEHTVLVTEDGYEILTKL